MLATGVAELRALGFSVLAQRIADRGRETTAGSTATIVVLRLSDRGTGWYVRAPFVELALDDWRVLSDRRFIRETKEWFVPLAKREALWTLLSAHYAGHELRSPKGQTTIPASGPQAQIAV